MNKINFNQTGGFPLSTNILDAMQSAYAIFNQLGSLAGNKAIISGCEQVGNNIADGVIFLNGEILPFKGGAICSSVIIKEESESRVFEDGATKPVIFKKYATFGSSLPEKTFAWSEFKKIFPTTEIQDFKTDFEKRIKALETRKSPIPIGLIAIWGKPASEPIPEGWRECTDLRGRFPLGWNPDDEDFNQLGKEDGTKTHTLTIDEMPSHSHKVPVFAGGSASGNRDGHPDNWIDNNRTVDSHSVGGNQPHNNMPPYRIIKFIEFIGF